LALPVGNGNVIGDFSTQRSQRNRGHREKTLQIKVKVKVEEKQKPPRLECFP
jgi:hypothetical protein